MNRIASIGSTAFFLGLVALTPPLPGWAGDLPTHGTERVAASVNEEAITIHDLDARVRLGLLAANLPDIAENRQRLTADTLRRLIDERLELQEATRLKIEVGDTEIATGVADLENQNHLAKDQLLPLLESKGIDPQTMREQIRAQVAWARVVRQELLPSIRIGEEELDARIKELKEGMNKVAFLAADIYLPVDDPKREAEVSDLADRLVDQLRKGAPFSALARQFSRAGGATGGDLGWVTRGMIDSSLLEALSKLEVGHASVPIRTGDGYHILLLRDKHLAGTGLSDEPTFDIAQIDLTILPSATDAERQKLLARFAHSVEKDKDCSGYEKHSGELAVAHYSRVGLIRPSDTPPDVRGLIADLKKGQMSEPLKLDTVYRFFIACERTEASNGLPSREEVRRRMQDERLELLAVRYLRDLRRAAFVEVRI